MKRIGRKIILFVVVVFVILGIWVVYRVWNRQSSTSDTTEEETFDRFAQGENELIMVSETGSLSQGQVLPLDFDFATYLPNLPSSSKILSVIDNNRENQRKISAKFEVYKSFGEFTDDLIFDLEKQGWDNVNLESESVVKANKDEIRLVVDIQNIDRYKTHATFVWIESKS